MHVQTRTWEGALLALADEGWRTASTAAVVNPVVDTALLADAYAYCETLTAEHSRSFSIASGLLPESKKRAVRALYAFCRITDDIVDCPDGDVTADLKVWRQHAFTHTPPTSDLAAVAWADARFRYHIPSRYAEQLVEGVSRDLVQNRYETFDELATYCYSVASTVGLMSMHIIGFAGPEAVPYAIKLGLALQLTNILRDVGEDWRRNRLYLPLEELAAFNLTEADVAAGVVDDRWRRFMRFQIARNRQLYAESWPGVQMLNADGRFAIAAAAGLYRGILDDIEAHDYDVFNRRAYIGTWGKLRRLPGLWLKSRG
ncbi:MAG: squalene/phytoene synthase family protein [Anaerolineales bacterium]|nr:squalene/phytoene synthase family protein [Anaerolineales bacterium]